MLQTLLFSQLGILIICCDTSVWVFDRSWLQGGIVDCFCDPRVRGTPKAIPGKSSIYNILKAFAIPKDARKEGDTSNQVDQERASFLMSEMKDTIGSVR